MEDFGWSGDEFLMGDCQGDWLDARADEWQERQDLLRELAEQEDQDADFEPDDCPMDGDAESALASIGWGMDEDYNGGCSDDPYGDW